MLLLSCNWARLSAKRRKLLFSYQSLKFPKAGAMLNVFKIFCRAPWRSKFRPKIRHQLKSRTPWSVIGSCPKVAVAQVLNDV